ncbi:hypothetical protein BJ138DRAFT_993289, partial [Hygrophoropsis aurantiaca]
HSQHHSHRCRLRSTTVVPVMLHNAFARPDRGDYEREIFCRSMLLLFKPWRELADIRGSFSSYVEAYDNFDMKPELKQLVRNMNVENECKDARDTY